LPKRKFIVGAKQTARAITGGNAAVVHIAQDAERRITAPVLELCETHGVTISECESMKSLGKLCGIAVGAAVAAEIIK
jgi:large subunit ribosomal protein L7A